MQCFLNGEIMPLEAAKISVMDRGFLFGDGIYEVVPAYRRRLFCRARHFRRLARNLSEIQINTDTEALAAPADTLIQSAPENCALYIQITRGTAESRRHIFPVPPPSPTVFMMPVATPRPAAEKYRDGVSCRTAEELRWNRADIKSTSLLGSVLAAQFAAETGAEEVILIRDGKVGEAAACNVFIAAGGVLRTPPADRRILPGISREIVLELAQREKIPTEEREITRAELGAADEILITSSTREVMPVAALDGAPVGTGKPGALFAALSAAFRRFTENGEE